MSSEAALVVGLTGGIGAGKSAVADLLAALGVTVVDTDLIAREVVAPGSEGLAEVQAAFGPEVLAADGGLDRAGLRERVFADARQRARLEALLHPRIRAEVRARLAAASGPYVVLVVPLLLERGGYEFVDRVLVVDCSEAAQVARVEARDGCTREQAERILAAQLGRRERLARADDVLRNDRDLEALREAVGALHRRYLALARERALRACENR